MKHSLHFFLATALLSFVNQSLKAYDFERDGLFYTVTSTTDLTVEVTYQSISNGSSPNETSSTITIPSTVEYSGQTYSVTSIGEQAFNWCTSLTSINIPSSVTSIGNNAFYYCSNLKDIIIPNGVTSIGNFSFCCCKSLPSITIPNSVTSIGKFAFDGCEGLTDVVLSENITKIDYLSFASCTNLKSITIPNSVTEIVACAFDGCSSLTTITIPNSVTDIGESAISLCRDLASIVIPSSCKNIGKNAFFGCNLTSIYCNAEIPPVCGEYTFDEDDKWKCQVFVPSVSLNRYKTASVWKDFYDIQENPNYTASEPLLHRENADAPTYTLQGIHTSAPLQQGIYIRSNKTIILK